MSFKPFPELITHQLILRKPRIKDWPVVLYLRSDKEVNKFVKRSIDDTREKATGFIEKSLSNIENERLLQWFICLKDDPEMIGSICLWNISEDKKTAEIGYDLSLAFHGKGIMDEAMKAVLEYGFKILSLDLIEAFTGLKNESSIKLLLRNNFQRNKKRHDQDNPDNAIFELTKSEYLQQNMD